MLIAKYTCNASGIVPTFNSGYVYEINEVESEGIYTVEITSESDFSSCSFSSKSELLTVEYLKVTSNVTTMISMFQNCNKLTSLDVSNFDTSNVANMQSMFSSCNKLTSLDVSNFNTSNVNYMNSMFYNCQSLTSLDLSNFDTSNVTTMYSMFKNCTTLTSIDLSSFRLDKCTTIFDMFADCHNIETIILPDEFCTSGTVTNMQRVFYQNYKLKEINISNFNTSNVTNMGYMFNNCNNLTSLDLSNFNTSNVTNMSYMFSGCNNLTELDVSNFDTSKVTTMYDMFFNCNKLISLDVSNFNTSNVNYMNSMFYNCQSLTSLDLSNFDTSNVIYMNSMFNGCNNLTSLDLSNFDTSKVTNFTNIFHNTSLLADIGMLYCSQDTINTIISLITNGTKTIWVKDTNASDYTATDYVTIKDYVKDRKTLYLNSPLLEEDEIVNKDGKLYHYHKMGKVVLDGSEEWEKTEASGVTTSRFYTHINNIKSLENNWKLGVIKYSDKFRTDVSCETSMADNIEAVSSTKDSDICINIESITSTTVFKQWLSENPTTVVYELANPYYELISDDALELQCFNTQTLIATDTKVLTTIKASNVGFKTLLKANTTYTISLNITPISVDLGGTILAPTSNVFTIKTPSTLAHNNLYVYGEGIVVNNVMLLEGNVLDYVPNFFEGMMSCFEENLITDENDEHYGKYMVEIKSVGQYESNRQVLYLNSPLLEGDEIVSIDGKLQHYHAYNQDKPYYEEIEFDMSKILLESYYNGHLVYNTIIPLSLTEVNYSADIPLVNALMEQAEIQDQQDAMILDNTVALAMINLMN